MTQTQQDPKKTDAVDPTWLRGFAGQWLENLAATLAFVERAIADSW